MKYAPIIGWELFKPVDSALTVNRSKVGLTKTGFVNKAIIIGNVSSGSKPMNLLKKVPLLHQ
jgi:hypothetical protein